MRKLNNPVAVYIIFAIFFTVGIFMLFMGFKSLAEGAGYVKTTATVISVREYKNDDGEKLGVPTYEYYVDGVRYEHERSYGQSYDICPYEGDTITIRYNKDDPGIVKDNSILTVVFFIFGVAFSGVGGTMFVLSALGKMHWVPVHQSYNHRRYVSVDRDDANPSESNTDPFDYDENANGNQNRTAKPDPFDNNDK